MRKLLLIISINFCSSCFAKSNPTEVEKLSITCKVWGFLKYYHPNVTAGKFNWDLALINFLPYVSVAETWSELNNYGYTAIQSLGPVRIFNGSSRPSLIYFEKNFNLEWFKANDSINNKNKTLLTIIENHPRSQIQYYVKYGEKKTAFFDNEINYEIEVLEDMRYRLLIFFNYWNKIEYFFPYKYLMDISWDSTLIEFIPIFKDAENVTLFDLAIMQLSARTSDSHSLFFTDNTDNFFGAKSIPYQIEWIESKFIVTNYLNDSLSILNKLKIGDEIIAIDNLPIQDFIEKKRKYLAHSTNTSFYRDIIWFVRHHPDDSIQMTISRFGKIFETRIKLYDSQCFSLDEKTDTKCYKILDDNIGYIDVGNLKINEVNEAFIFLRNTKSLIIDLRSYPKETILSAMEIRLHKTKQIYANRIYPDLSYPGKFIWEEGGIKTEVINDLKQLNVYSNSVFIIVNQNTQSQGEFCAMSFMTIPQSTIIGSSTSGTNGNAVNVNLYDRKEIYMTSIGIFNQDSTQFQRKGVRIDYEVKPTIKGIVNGEDEVLDFAVKIINQSKK